MALSGTSLPRPDTSVSEVVPDSSTPRVGESATEASPIAGLSSTCVLPSELVGFEPNGQCPARGPSPVQEPSTVDAFPSLTSSTLGSSLPRPSEELPDTKAQPSARAQARTATRTTARCAKWSRFQRTPPQIKGYQKIRADNRRRACPRTSANTSSAATS